VSALFRVHNGLSEEPLAKGEPMSKGEYIGSPLRVTVSGHQSVGIARLKRLGIKENERPINSRY
jgi:hypothetical protein